LAQEVARLAGAVLTEYAALQRKLPQAKPHASAYADLHFGRSTPIIPDYSRSLIG